MSKKEHRAAEAPFTEDENRAIENEFNQLPYQTPIHFQFRAKIRFNQNSYKEEGIAALSPHYIGLFRPINGHLQLIEDGMFHILFVKQLYLRDGEFVYLIVNHPELRKEVHVTCRGKQSTRFGQLLYRNYRFTFSSEEFEYQTDKDKHLPPIIFEYETFKSKNDNLQKNEGHKNIVVSPSQQFQFAYFANSTKEKIPFNQEVVRYLHNLILSGHSIIDITQLPLELSSNISIKRTKSELIKLSESEMAVFENKNEKNNSNEAVVALENKDNDEPIEEKVEEKVEDKVDEKETDPVDEQPDETEKTSKSKGKGKDKKGKDKGKGKDKKGKDKGKGKGKDKKGKDKGKGKGKGKGKNKEETEEQDDEPIEQKEEVEETKDEPTDKNEKPKEDSVKEEEKNEVKVDIQIDEGENENDKEVLGDLLPIFVSLNKMDFISGICARNSNKPNILESSVQLISLNQKLRIIHFENCGAKTGLKALSDTINKASDFKVAYWNLADNENIEDIDQFPHIIENSTVPIQYLNLSYCRISPSNSAAIFKALSENEKMRNLEFLIYSGNRLGKESAGSFRSFLDSFKNTKLRYLDFSSMTSEDMALILKNLNEYKLPIETLILRGFKMDENARLLGDLTSFITNSEYLNTLDLSYMRGKSNKLDLKIYECLSDVIGAIAGNPNLEKIKLCLDGLDLHGPNILILFRSFLTNPQSKEDNLAKSQNLKSSSKKQSSQSLAKSTIRRNFPIWRSLTFNSNGMDDKDLENLTSIFTRMENLTELSFNDNFDESMPDIEQNLLDLLDISKKKNIRGVKPPKLTKISIAGTPPSDEYLHQNHLEAKIIPFLNKISSEYSSSIVYLDISYNHIKDGMINPLKNLFHSQDARLETLLIDGNKIPSAKMLRELAEASNDCQSLITFPFPLQDAADIIDNSNSSERNETIKELSEIQIIFIESTNLHRKKKKLPDDLPFPCDESVKKLVEQIMKEAKNESDKLPKDYLIHHTKFCEEFHLPLPNMKMGDIISDEIELGDTQIGEMVVYERRDQDDPYSKPIASTKHSRNSGADDEVETKQLSVYCVEDSSASKYYTTLNADNFEKDSVNHFNNNNPLNNATDRDATIDTDSDKSESEKNTEEKESDSKENKTSEDNDDDSDEDGRKSSRNQRSSRKSKRSDDESDEDDRRSSRNQRSSRKNRRSDDESDEDDRRSSRNQRSSRKNRRSDDESDEDDRRSSRNQRSSRKNRHSDDESDEDDRRSSRNQRSSRKNRRSDNESDSEDLRSSKRRSQRSSSRRGRLSENSDDDDDDNGRRPTRRSSRSKLSEDSSDYSDDERQSGRRKKKPVQRSSHRKLSDDNSSETDSDESAARSSRSRNSARSTSSRNSRRSSRSYSERRRNETESDDDYESDSKNRRKRGSRKSQRRQSDESSDTSDDVLQFRSLYREDSEEDDIKSSSSASRSSRRKY